MIFFDIDGTLIDHKKSEKISVLEFYKKYILGLGLICEEEFFQLWVRTSDKHFNRFLRKEITFEQQRRARIKEICLVCGEEIFDREADIRFEFYLENYEKNWQLFDDVIDCLECLKNNRLGIISNGDLSQQINKLEKTGIEKYFEFVVAAGQIGAAKPDLKIFEEACKKARLSPDITFYVGDDLSSDVIACSKIGMKGIWINRDNQVLTDDNIVMINNLRDLPKALKARN